MNRKKLVKWFVAMLTIAAVTIASAQPPAGPAKPSAGNGSGSAGSANPVPVQDPPTGPGLGKNPTPSPVKPAVVLTGQDLEVLKDIEGEYEQFTSAGEKHDKRMRAIAKREFDTRTTELTKRYADKIAKTEAAKQRHHGDTVAMLEKFLINHPSHETFTPDAMYRLADLYLDKADDEVEAKLAALENAPPPQPGAPAPAEIVADYSPSLKLWEDILVKFPKYRQTPATLYLLAYYGKTKDERKSLTVFLALACANKFKWNDKPIAAPTREEALKRAERKQLRDPWADCKPYPEAEVELVRHAWVRGVADYTFTIPGELDESIAAYLKVANGGNESKLYAESLYKLAWSYYKRDYLPNAIERFDASVKLYDQIVTAGGIPALELRDESIQYISVAFTDPWEGETNSDPNKAMERAKAFYKGRENEPHVRDVWVALGKAFAELQAWDQAVDAYRTAIGPPWELNPKNPMVHQEIVNVFELKGDKFAADNAAAELATRYAPGTPWYAANEKDREAMDNQRRIAERALYAAARNTHSAATQMRKDYELAKTKDPAAKKEYLAMYNKAIDLYRTFINTYAESDYVYEFTYNAGEALYYSERYMEAVENYKWVRDHRDIGTAFYIDAARSVVQSYEAEAQRQVSENKLAALKVPTSAELKALKQPWPQQQIPDLYLKLQAEYDNYQNIVNDSQAAPSQGINAALISLAYFHIDDAIARFQKVMDKFCGSADAMKAKDGILAIYEAKADFDAIQRTNDKFIAQKCGDAKAIELAKGQNRSLNFSRANELYAKGQFAQAADAYYRFYKTAPPNDTDLATALYNAAISYQQADKPKTAISLFKEFTSNPAKSFRESKYYLNALGLQAATYQKAYDYENAVKTYLELSAIAKKAKQLKLAPPPPLPGQQPKTFEQIGLDALFNAALASELNRDFKKSIDLYKQYGAVEKDRRKQDRALWSIGGIQRQSGDVNAMVATQQKWRAQFGKDAGNEDDYVQTFYDESQLRKKKGQTPQANKAGQATIDAWKAKGSTKNSRGAKLAGEWQLQLAEDHYTKSWESFEIKKAARSVAEAKLQSKQMLDAKTKAEDKYLALDAYGVAEYTMAAKVRYGIIAYEYATKLGNIPIPAPVAKNDALVEAYQTKLDENVKKYLDEAKGQWIEVVDLAKKGGISNKWSRLALENLGREFPAEFTVLRQEIVQGTEAP